MLIDSPVRGLRPVDALRWATLNVPNPTRRTSCFLDRAPEIESNTLSTALAASVFDMPALSATAATRSFLFKINPPYMFESKDKIRLLGTGCLSTKARPILKGCSHSRQSRNLSFPQFFAVFGHFSGLWRDPRRQKDNKIIFLDWILDKLGQKR